MHTMMSLKFNINQSFTCGLKTPLNKHEQGPLRHYKYRFQKLWETQETCVFLFTRKECLSHLEGQQKSSLGSFHVIMIIYMVNKVSLPSKIRPSCWAKDPRPFFIHLSVSSSKLGVSKSNPHVGLSLLPSKASKGCLNTKRKGGNS